MDEVANFSRRIPGLTRISRNSELEALLDSLPQPVLVFDVQTWRIQLANQKLVDASLYSRQELVGLDARKLFAGGPENTAGIPILQAQPCTNQLVRHDQSQLTVQLSTTPLKNKETFNILFIEPVEASPEVYVFGAGHVGYSVAKLAHEVGFRVHVVDDREKFASTERFGEGIDVVVDDIPTWLQAHQLPPTSYAVIVTRGHRHDLDALRALTASPLRYLGLIGSKAKVKRIFDALREEGTSPDRLRPVHAPIGLDIGAITPQEIAVSIVAELIAVKHGKIAEPTVAAVSMRWEGALRR